MASNIRQETKTFQFISFSPWCRCHWQILELPSYAMHSDWFIIVMWLGASNHSGSTLKFVSGIGSLSISFQLRPTKERFLLKKSSNQSIDRSKPWFMIFKMKKNFQMKVSHNFFHLLRYSVTRLLVYVFNLGHLQQWNFAQYHTLFCQRMFKMLVKLNKPSKYYKSFKILPKWRNFTKSGHTAMVA